MKKTSLIYFACLLTSFSTKVFLAEQPLNPNNKFDIYEAYDDDDEESPLHIAAEFNNLDEINRLIKNGANIEEKNIFKETPLHFAATTNNPEAIELLVKLGAKINALDDEEQTPLFKAIILKNINAINKLLSLNCNVNSLEINGYSALLYTIMLNNIKIMENLINYGANLNIQNCYDLKTPLHMAVLCNNNNAVIKLLKSGANVNIKNEDNKTPLELATQQNRNEIIEIFKKYTGPINTINTNAINKSLETYDDIEFDKDEDDPEIIKAIKNNNIKTLKNLLKKPEIFNITDSDEYTSLCCAIICNNTSALKEILHTLDINKTDLDNMPLLSSAILINNIEIAKELIKHGAILDQTKSGQTPLHTAATVENTELIKLLIEHGANKNITIPTQKKIDLGTPLHFSVYFNKSKAVKALLALDCKTEIQDNNRQTPLSWAVFMSRTKIVEKLLKFGANVNTQDNNLQTPLHIAAQFTNKKIISLLRNYKANTKYNYVDVSMKNIFGETALDVYLNRMKFKNEKPDADIVKLLS